MSTRISIKVGKDRRSQAAMTVMFAAMMGEAEPQTCEKCGGIVPALGALSGRCGCKVENKEASK